VKNHAFAAAEAVRRLWQPDAVRKLAGELAEIAADTLVQRDGPVRRPGSPRLAAKIVEQGVKKPELTVLLREIQKCKSS
jgi:hypothetical protein